MAAVQLGDRKKIQRSGKQPNPSCTADGVKQNRGWGDARVKPGSEGTKQQWNTKNKVDVGASEVGKAGNDFGMEDAVSEGGNCKHKTDERAGSADVKQGAGGSNRRTNQNEGAKRADEGGKWNEKRIGSANVMMAASEKVAQLMGEKNGEQGESKRNAGDEASRVFVEKREGVDKFVEGSCLIISVGDGELCAGGEAGTKSEKKQDGCDDQHLGRWAAGNRSVAKIAERHGAPIDVDRNGWLGILWEWWGHEIFRAANSVRTEQYNTDAAVRASS